ncbi:MAG: Holliday junction branch migration protein RuvA [Deltaproteobacteria bacterium]|nr:Holliday junction branch migration protein RuvA [Deltaproteobacteria bacterium]
MIAQLSGVLARKAGDGHLVVDVGGVGYGVQVSSTTLDKLPAEGEPVSVCVFTHVRQDAIALFGFADLDERAVFEALISLNGVGPRAALGVLSGIESRELARAICNEDLARLCLVPGVGKKKAERMVLELKDKLLPLAGEPQERPDAVVADLRSALANLGFKATEAERAIAALKKRILDGAELEALVPEALRLLRE